MDAILGVDHQLLATIAGFFLLAFWDRSAYRPWLAYTPAPGIKQTYLARYLHQRTRIRPPDRPVQADQHIPRRLSLHAHGVLSQPEQKSVTQVIAKDTIRTRLFGIKVVYAHVRELEMNGLVFSVICRRKGNSGQQIGGQRGLGWGVFDWFEFTEKGRQTKTNYSYIINYLAFLVCCASVPPNPQVHGTLPLRRMVSSPLHAIPPQIPRGVAKDGRMLRTSLSSDHTQDFSNAVV